MSLNLWLASNAYHLGPVQMAARFSLIFALAVAGCASVTVAPSPSPSASLPAWLATVPSPTDATALPTAPPPSPGTACATALLAQVRLAGSRDHSPAVWVEGSDGTRHDVLWPWGFYARFTPSVEVYSGDGRLVAKAGEVLDLGGSLWPDTEAWYACQIKGVWYTWPSG